MAGRPELAGDGREGATDHGFPNQKLPEREEGEGNSPRAKTRPEKRPRGPRHGRPRRTTPACTGGALEGLVLLGKRTRREREGRGSSPTRRNAAKRAPIGGTTRGGACCSSGARCPQDETESGENRMGRGVRFKLGRGRSPLQAKTRGGRGGDRGRGERARRLKQREERGESGAAVGEEGADRRARPVSG